MRSAFLLMLLAYRPSLLARRREPLPGLPLITDPAPNPSAEYPFGRARHRTQRPTKRPAFPFPACAPRPSMRTEYIAARTNAPVLGDDGCRARRCGPALARAVF